MSPINTTREYFTRQDRGMRAAVWIRAYRGVPIRWNDTTGKGR